MELRAQGRISAHRLYLQQFWPAARNYQQAVTQPAWPLDRPIARRPPELARRDRTAPKRRQPMRAFGPPLGFYEDFSF
jgi:hypothetical protein